MARFLVDSVSVAFGKTAAVRDASLRIEPGEQVGLIGPSGAGKTTLLRLLVGAVRPSSGRVLVDGRDLSSLPNGDLRRVRSEIGFIYQDHRLISTQRVLTNVLAGRLGRWSLLGSLRELSFPRKPEIQSIHRLLARVGIPEKLYQHVDSLSEGQQQRVAIARALYQEPKALLADEPVSSVDPARAHDTIELLTTTARERDLTLLVSLHDLELARELFPRLIGMRHGRIAFDCPTNEVTDRQLEELYLLTTEEMLQDA